jgi:hypothetical protein
MTTITHDISPDLLQRTSDLMRRLQMESLTHIFPEEISKKSPAFFDFTASNESVKGLVRQGGIHFQKYVDDTLDTQQTNWGIGKYMERRDGVLEGTHIASEERFYHLGVDVAHPHGTPLLCPVEGEIYKTGYSPEWGDYGHFISTRHQLEGKTFYLFFGHLKEGSYLTSGMVSAGQQLGLLGDFQDNGQWFHHTHIQICMDTWDKSTPDGYCHERDQEYYRYLNPDPMIFVRNA